MKHWQLQDVDWENFDPCKVDPAVVPLVKAAAMVERNGIDYAIYLKGVFSDDPDFQRAADNWAVEEVQHGDALGRWATLADPGWDYAVRFERYSTGYKLPLGVDASVRGSRTGELIARCIVETGTSSYYTALGEATDEPVLQQICRLIAADEYRHFKLFYDHMRRYTGRENINLAQRLRIAAGRIGETEDDELAFAFHCANETADSGYDHEHCMAAYLAASMGYYRFRHIDRATGMIMKAIGLPPRGRMSGGTARLSWQLMQWRRRRLNAKLAGAAARPGGANDRVRPLAA